MANVTVISKLPFALIAEHKGVQVTLNGANSTQFRDQNGNIPDGSFGITQVEQSFFEAWKTENASLEPLQKGLIFAKSSENAAIGEAKANAEQKTGLEGLRQDMKDDRLPQNDQKRLKSDNAKLAVG